MTELVVGRPLLLVAEHLVGLLDLLELLLGLRIIRVAIRMVLHRQPAVGLLDLHRGGRAADTQYLVIVALGHARTLGLRG